MTYQKGKTDREHRFVAKEMLGRELMPDEVVHHIDGNKRNNSPDNLLVVTRSEHAKIHRKDISRKKRVIQLSKDGEVLATWDSAKEAGKSVHVFPGNISKCCRGHLKSTGGYLWKFAV